ncbi:DUF1972 domain-containing protein [Janthinobacterium sp. GW458P]|uniref:DUF1972 domain-containing protein n=1 Tax=Janthinobacterium sp. GW458P TaxID=1981504 RepID=UPI000A320F8A|nr:DUF1972 domain-containing protein [Janthinobacterium sp. GW458P]MBE3023613.1 DUF1972 domain-containing protein [Janthinobacterium sp. GW458P]
MLKKIAIVGSVGLPARYGGWETLVDHLTRHLATRYEFTVYCSAKKYDEKLSSYNGAKLEYIDLDANGVQSIPYDVVSMLKACRFADVIVVLGVSGCIFLPFIKLITKKKIIVNIDGLEWRRAKWSKFAKWFLKKSEAAAVRAADVVVVDNQAIQAYVQSQYGRTGVLIAYGADHAQHRNLAIDALQKYAFASRRYAFKVCRIEPENNIDIILECFSMYSDMDMVMIGNWNNSSYGEDLRKKYSHLPHLHLLDPIYDPEILNQIRGNCHIYIHGHSAGGTNPSLVEAMYLGLPIAYFDCDFNRFTTHGAGLPFADAAGLKVILETSSAEQLTAIGVQMQALAGEFYTWDRIANQYAQLF